MDCDADARGAHETQRNVIFDHDGATPFSVAVWE